MKTLLFTVVGILMVIFFSMFEERPTIEEIVEIQIESSQKLTDSALNELRYLHLKNDSLLDQYFPKE